MPASPAAGPAEGLRLRQLVAWAGFAALLALGIALFFHFAGRILPMLDAIADR